MITYNEKFMPRKILVFEKVLGDINFEILKKTCTYIKNNILIIICI